MKVESSNPATLVNIPDRPGARLWRNRNFNIFWLGQALSNLGDAFALIGLPLAVLQATNSVTQMGLVTALLTLGQIVAALVSGVLADRLNRRWLMLGCDLGRLVSYGSLPLIWWLNGPQPWLLYLVAGIGGFLEMCFDITYTTAIADLVDPDQITEANGRLQTTYGLAFMIGPGLAGIISALFGPVVALGLNGGSFAISVVTLSIIRFQPVNQANLNSASSSGEIEEEKHRPDLFDQWISGMHFLFRTPSLRAVTLILVVYLTVSASAVNLFLFYLKSNLGQDDSSVGLVFSFASFGSILAGLLVGRIRRKIGFGISFLGSIVIASLSVAAVGFAPTILVVAPLTIIFALADTARNICSMSLRQQVTPNEMLGRVTSAFRTLIILPFPIGAVLNTALADHWGGATILVVMGGLGLIAAFLGVFTPANARHPETMAADTFTGQGLPRLTGRQRKRWRRNIVLIFSGFLAFIILLSTTAFLWLVIRPLPQTSGTLQLPGLSAEVTIVRDKWGVPQITASNTADLFMAQGYVTAQDRLWQMEFNRRIGAGRLSEVLGPAALDQDRYLRTLGLRQAAQLELDRLSPLGRQALESYAKGVNAFIETHRDNLPLEFSLLGFQPEPWTPLDSLSWGRVMDYNLAGNYDREILRATLIDKLGSDKALSLLPLSALEGASTIIPPGVSYQGIGQNLDLLDLKDQLTALVDGDSGSKGSNNWVVGGAKTTTGKPLLANDPHLGLTNPSIWYEVHLIAPGWNVAGVSFPGEPGVISGHNDRIAWAVTNVEGDTQDLFIEKINPANPNQYEYKGVWVDMQIRTEEIKIKNRPSYQLAVRTTRHGPLINDIEPPLKNYQPLALEWVALGPARLLDGVLQYDQASNWTEFRQALRSFEIAAQNFIYADADGNIGYQIPGLWPLRPKGDGLLPVPGWTGEYDWTGYANFDDLPTMYNPSTNFIVTANQKPTVMPKAFLGEEFHPGWRAARITELIQAKEKLTIDDFKAIQTDVKSTSGQEFAGYLTRLSNPSAKSAQALKRLENWNGLLTADSVPGAIYKVTYQYVLEDVLKAKLGSDLYNHYLTESRFHVPFILNLLKDPQNEWWGPGGRDTLLQKSLDQAVDYLGSRLGNNPDNWKWGKLHSVSFTETPLGSALPFPLQLIMNLKTVETGGDINTVAAGSYRFNDPYLQVAGASFRDIVSLANFDDSLIVNSGGQSGQPFSKFYGSNIDDWSNGNYHSFTFSSQTIERNKDTVLILRP